MWRPLRRTLILATTLLPLAGCASASRAPAVGRVPVAPTAAVATTGSATACDAVVASTLAGIGRRIYAQAAHGRNVVAAVRRLRRSRALAGAVGRGDPAATRAALVPLLKHQIRRISITRGSRVLAQIAGPQALAPVHGVLRNAAGRPVGRYVLSVSDASAIAEITSTLTGADVTITSGGRTLQRATAAGATGHATRTVSYRATAFPRGALRVALALRPAAPTVCAPTSRGTAAQVVGAVGERLVQTEAHGAAVQRVLRVVATDPQLRAAVAHDDGATLRTAIVRLFGNRTLHVVRVRATTTGGRLVGDVGGPYVLSPASRTVRGATGRPLGTVTLAIQDDTGYIKLMHRFTGADVLLRTGAGPVPGSSLAPGPATIPARGAVTYRGRRFDAYRFTARAFPHGPLTVALLLPQT
ncbi:MAG TPA: hypothetical protein VGO71_17125 [Baekduia sp.]|jgi:hypothetical protein|nr:hypothetical protein [Baekduia sp.]